MPSGGSLPRGCARMWCAGSRCLTNSHPPALSEDLFREVELQKIFVRHGRIVDEGMSSDGLRVDGGRPVCVGIPGHSATSVQNQHPSHTWSETAVVGVAHPNLTFFTYIRMFSGLSPCWTVPVFCLDRWDRSNPV